MSDDEAPKVPSELVSCLTKNSTWKFEAQGNLVQRRDERYTNLPEDVNLTQISEDAGFTRTVGQFSVTNSAGVTSSCREYMYPRDDRGTYTKGFC